jgi:hypothetical protein
MQSKFHFIQLQARIAEAHGRYKGIFMESGPPFAMKFPYWLKALLRGSIKNGGTPPFARSGGRAGIGL